MKTLMRSIATISAISLAAIAVTTNPAQAQTATGLQGSYLGGGISIGALGDGAQGTIGGNVTGRLDIPSAPISLRGSSIFTDQNAAFLPTITGDIPIAQNTNLFLGGGASLLLNNNDTPIGNRDAFVFTAGLESEVAPNMVLYGNTNLGLNAINNSYDDALSFQVGGAYKF